MHKRRSNWLITLLLASSTLVFMSCEKKEYQTIEELDNENINRYILENNLQVERYKNTDLYYEIIREGTGEKLDFTKQYPLVYSTESLDGVYQELDTFDFSNRYYDYLGYFPFGSVAAGTPNSPVERQDDLKYVIRDILQYENGQIRILVPSRLTAWGRQGNRQLGVPPNASLDYTISIHGDLQDYEDRVIQQSIVTAGFSVDDFVKTEDDIYYRISAPGTGDVISADSTITANYILRDPAGVEVERGDELRLDLRTGISAWSKIIPLIREGGSVRFFTPSKHAYGIGGSTNVPPFLSLDFEVSIVESSD